MKQITFMLILAALVGYGLLSYHFVLFDESLQILKKTEPRYQHTFVDARGVKKLEIALKPDLIAAGINNLIGHVDSTLHKGINQ